MATPFHLKPFPNGSSNLMGWDYTVTDETEGNEVVTLTVQFKWGQTYQYKDVPLKEVKDLLEAESHGKYFNAHIKDKYETIKI